jgi:cytochrome d ubiquinol oxidase subunit II
MSKADVVAAILVAGATLYATFGGADFGAGVWELLALRSRDRSLRERVEYRVTLSLGPVWEANHVWLIFTLVVLWTGFPDAFAPIMETLYLPLALAALGIVLRGSGFAFGHTFAGAGARRAHAVFAISSLITPFFLGCVVGSIAAGDVEAGGSRHAIGWIGPLALLVGVRFVSSFADIAAVFLLDDCRRAREDDLEPYFLHRSIAAAVVTGVLAAVGLLVLRADARPIFDGLLDEGLPFVIASALLGLLTLAGLLRGWSRALRPLAIGAVVAVVAGWAVAQYPYLLPETLTVEEGAGDGAALTALIVVFIAALLIVVPALALLFRLAQRQALE